MQNKKFTINLHASTRDHPGPVDLPNQSFAASPPEV